MRSILLAACFAQAALALEYHKYVIVGGGPGGMQMAHFLHSANKDYVVLEQHEMAGSFFVKYPRWRQLIRYVDRQSPPKLVTYPPHIHVPLQHQQAVDWQDR